jgi:pimeloyl-ACP methyl ester carboxylesterase
VAPQTADRFVTVGEARLHYVDEGSGRPVVMIHGNAGDLQDFRSGTLDLMAHNYRTIAFDLPGHGLSKALRNTRGTIQEQAKILHQALTALEIKDPILVGHSWGGAVLLWFYWRQRPTRIVIAMRRRVFFCASRCSAICVSVYLNRYWVDGFSGTVSRMLSHRTGCLMTT